MLNNVQFESFRYKLFTEESNNVYAVIDGAAVKELRFKLHQWQPEHACLWSGQLEPDMAEVAPYLVRLEYEAAFTGWLIEQGGDQHWNIYVSSPLSLKALRKHLRQFLLVKDAAGETVLFRYYDPRVLHHFKAVADEHQASAMVGDGLWYYPNPDQSGSLESWTYQTAESEMETS